ncbi:MAG: hypothetical protein ACRBDI_00585 [Alphaproteobacteria bacterium]
MSTPQTQQQKTIIRIMLFMTGIIALVLATMCFAIPENIEEMMSMDTETVNILGIILTVIGLGDLAVSLIIFKRRDRK